MSDGPGRRPDKGEAADRGSLPPRGGVGFGVGLALHILRLARGESISLNRETV